VTDDQDFRCRMEQIGDLVQKMEGIADPAVRAAAKELVARLMELHGTGLERMLEITFGAGGPAMGIIDAFGRDPLVGSLLILYGLHPEPLGTRVTKALEQIRPRLRKQGGEIELISLEEGVVRIRIEAAAHTCGSTVKTLRSTVEEAIYGAAPDIASLLIDGPESKASSGFVALEKLMGDHRSLPVGTGPALVSRVEGAD
jgi:Fe-S cluster biogenesis protein NfuA